MERQANNPIKRKSTVLKELIEEGRIAKNELETKRMALEEKKCLQADKEKQELFADIVAQQQQQQAFFIEQQTQCTTTPTDNDAPGKPSPTADLSTTTAKANGRITCPKQSSIT